MRKSFARFLLVGIVAGISGVGFTAATPRAAAADALDECFPPGPPTIPDGASASGTEMVRVEQQMKLFRESATSYTQCADERLKRFGPRVPDRKRERWVKERQKIVESIQSATERYNESVRAYRARFPGSAGSAGGTPPPAPPTPPSSTPKTGS